ncbi:hypothetical protein [Pediococcus acidilactici]|uniref:hypothetical protein n=1 Tax=Pediococcus acidilactici TaxID=1254 RepID=UPI0013D4860C|nr:hypothetical protein [Pediococcus acidilactici]
MEVETPKLFLRIFPSLKNITLVFPTLFCLEVFAVGRRDMLHVFQSPLFPINQNKAPTAFHAIGALAFNGFITMLYSQNVLQPSRLYGQPN